MSAHPRVVLTDTTYAWGEARCTYFLPKGSDIDAGPGSALEAAIGAQNLGTLSNQALQDAANGAGGATSNLRGTDEPYLGNHAASAQLSGAPQHMECDPGEASSARWVPTNGTVRGRSSRTCPQQVSG
jgi:hypothetical protein